MARLCVGAVLSVACLVPDTTALAQSFTWGGTGTSDYALATNWSNPGIAPPFLPGQSAIFGATGSSTVVVDLSHLPIPFFQPDSWTFSADAQSVYSINNANAGQTITIANNINDGFDGVSIIPVSVQQLGNSTLVLAGANSYSGGTLISAGTVQVNTADSLGAGTVTLNGGTLQMTGIASANFSNNFAVNAPGGAVDVNGGQVTFSGVIADGMGAGVLSLIDSAGAGTVQLSGVNTYSGGTLVSGTTLIVTNNSSVGTGTVALDNNGLFQADGLSNLTSPTISGSTAVAAGSTPTAPFSHLPEASRVRASFRSSIPRSAMASWC
jgi:autotransporter-associated beta strand protein